MINHQTLFNMGPIITIAILKPLNYFDANTTKQIGRLLDTEKTLTRMNTNLEVSWLADLYSNMKTSAEFFDHCKPPVQYKCFEQTLQTSTLNFEFYADDLVVAAPGNQRRVIEKLAIENFFVRFSVFFSCC